LICAKCQSGCHADRVRTTHLAAKSAASPTILARIRQHSTDLSATVDRLRANANSLNNDWDSAAGREASSRLTELGTWYESHASHATSLAAVLDTHGDNYGRARTSVPPPDRFDNVERRLQMAIAANQAPASLGRYTPLTVACTRSWPNSMVKPCRAMRTTRPPLRTPALPTIRCNRRCGPVSKRSTMTAR